MKTLILSALALCSSLAFAAAEVGKPAPDFALTGNDGKVHKLSEFKGKDVVVLEWYNEGCPYVHKHYDSGNMQRLQKEFTAASDVKWFTVASGAPGKQGYIKDVAAAEKLVKEHHMNNTALLMDSKQEMAKAYGAKTTPHMFVIDKKGMIAYNGAIDSETTARPMNLAEYTKDTKIAKYVEQAIVAVKSDRAPAMASTDPYGCSVKY